MEAQHTLKEQCSGSVVRVDDLVMKISQSEFELFIIKALGLPDTCTEVSLHMRAGKPTMAAIEFVTKPITLKGNAVATARALLYQDTRMRDWWVRGGWRTGR